MPTVSFIFNCAETPPVEVTELHAFGPVLHPIAPERIEFHPDFAFQLANPDTSPILAVSRGRLFLRENKLFLQPFHHQRIGTGSGARYDEEELPAFDRLYGQPFVFCYKNVDITDRTITNLLTAQAERSGREIEDIASKIQRFQDGQESIYVYEATVIGSANTDGLAFEIFYIPNGIMESMPGGQSGLDLILRHFTNPLTRRIDPLFFFASISNAQRVNYPKISETEENPIFARFTRRILLEIRDEYDHFFEGTYGILDEVREFNEANHGMVSLMDVPPGEAPVVVFYDFSDDNVVFTRLPSGTVWSRRVQRHSSAPYHHATQRIFMHNYVHDHVPVDPRSWFARNTLSTFTQNNHVEYLIDGIAAFNAMVEALSLINSPEHYVRIAGWYLNITFPLIPGDSTTTLEEILDRINGTGAKINALVWQNQSDGLIDIDDDCQYAVLRINQFSNGRAIMDDNGPGLAGSVHQKILIIKNANGLVAFCGGMDISESRLHDRETVRTEWHYHDIHASVIGGAASELDRTFVQRWNAHVMAFNNAFGSSGLYVDSTNRLMRRPTRDEPDRPSPGSITVLGTEYTHDIRPRLSRYTGDSAEGAGKAFVQVTRTYAPSVASTLYPFQPLGEVGTLNALKKAISRAKKYIYIEDQYLYPYAGDMPDDINHISDTRAGTTLYQDRNGVGILDALYRQLQANSELIVILVTSSFSFFEPSGNAHSRMRFIFNMLKHARGGSPEADRTIVHCYPFSLTNYYRSDDNHDHVRVHSKAWLIDDIYVKIGSANCCRRSLTHDPEADIHVIDGALENGHRKFARQFRKALWAEHLGFTNPEQLDDLDYALNLWLNLSTLPEAKVAVNTRILPTDMFPASWDLHVDPEGRIGDPPTNPEISDPDPSYD